jgi:hypothetical protein
LLLLCQLVTQRLLSLGQANHLAVALMHLQFQLFDLFSLLSQTR